jgi:hypothetical protein
MYMRGTEGVEWVDERDVGLMDGSWWTATAMRAVTVNGKFGRAAA